MRRILFVDDDKNILNAYRRTFFNKYEFVMADSGSAALEIVNSSEPFHVIVVDYQMPGMNGVELLSIVRNISPDTIQIMLTGQADMQAIIDLINKGKIFRFLTKPCAQDDMILNIDAAIRQYDLVYAERELLGKTLGGSIKVLTDLLALVKPIIFYKSQRIRSLCKKIYNEIDVENKWQIEIATLLSQIGAVTIPDEILKKYYKDLKLSEDEMIMFRNHPLIGSDMLKSIPRMEKIADIIRYQGKNYDGSGFPEDNISGEAIPVGSRILRIALDYDNGINAGKEQDRILNDMKKKPDIYDSKMVEIACVILTGPSLSNNSFISKEVSPDQMTEEMYLAEDVVSATGLTLGNKNQKITSALITAFQNYEKNHQIKNQIKVIVRSDVA